MAQHDYNIANQSGADFRADLNNALLAIATVNSGSTEPSTTFAHQLWVDTSSSVLKIRNGADNAWITTGVSITASNTFTGNLTGNVTGNLTGNVTGNVTGDLTGNADTATTLATARTISLSGDVAGSASFDGSGDITITTTAQIDSIALGTDTTGDYVQSISGGTGVTITGGTGEGSTPSVAIGQAVATTDNVTFNIITATNEFIGDLEGGIRFNAKADGALSKGDVVYISGVSGDVPTVAQAKADDASKMPAFGLALSDANDNAALQVVTFGTIEELDTSGVSEGQILYVSTTAGAYTTTAPTGESSQIQNIGKVIRSHAAAGSIKVGGAGRSNATPNLNNGKIFIGNGSNQSSTATLDTSIVVENTNLYYTTTRANTDFDTRLATKDTGDLTEGSNLYYTTARVNSDFDTRLATKDTGDLAEGTNLYYTTARFDSAFTSKDTDDLSEGLTNLYYTTARFDSAFSNKTTADLTENTNLYYTDTRANSAIDTRVTKAFVDALNVQAASVDANSVTLGTDTVGNYVATVTGTANKITVSGSGSESAAITLSLPDDVQIADSLTVAGNLTVNGTLTSLDTTNLDIEDNLFQLNAGLTGSPVNDSGMLINRGNLDNGIFMWDESVDKFTLGLTTADGSATGNITLNSLGTLVANLEGNVTGNVTGIVSSISNHSTSDLSEGTNLYYTQARFDSALAAKSTSDLSEGSNLYYTDARAQAVSINNVVEDTTPQLGGNLDLNSSDITGTGDINITGTIQSSGNITGTLATAAQPNITSLGTLTGLNVAGTPTFDGLTVQTTDGFSSLLESSISYQYLQFKNSGETNNYIGFVNDDFVITPANNQKMIVTAEGNVGIGTSSPDKLLHLKTSVINTAVMRIESTATDSYPHLEFKNDARTYGIYGAHGQLSDSFSIYDGTAGAHRLTISSSGNVGIGSASPDSLLHLHNTSQNSYIHMSGGGSLGETYGGFIRGYGVSGEGGHLELGVFDNATKRVGIEITEQGNEVIFDTAGTERMRIDSSGNVGIGTVPESWNSAFRALDIGVNGALISQTASGGDELHLISNGYYDGAWKYKESNSANQIILNNGAITFEKAASGTANAALTWEETMRIDSSGNVGIGTTSPSTALDISATTGAIKTTSSTGTNIAYNAILNTGGGLYLGLERSTGGGLFSGSSGYDAILGHTGAYKMHFATSNTIRATIDSSGNVGIGTSSPSEKLSINNASGNAYLQCISGNGNLGGVWVGDQADNYVGGFLYDNNIDASLFYTNNAEAMRIDASGNVGIGLTNPDAYYSKKLVVNANNSGITLVSPTNSASYIMFADGTGSAEEKYRGYFEYSHAIDTLISRSAGDIRFLTGGSSERMRIKSDGQITTQGDILPGADVIMANGRGISFAASSNAGGMTSELLDDYEEGTWTPSLGGNISASGQVYSVQEGTYTKIGRQVTCRFNLSLSTEGSFSNVYILLQGLPFTIASSPSTIHMGNLYFTNLGANFISLGLQAHEGNSQAYIWGKTTASVSREYLGINDLTNNTQLTGTFTYFV